MNRVRTTAGTVSALFLLAAACGPINDAAESETVPEQGVEQGAPGDDDLYADPEAAEGAHQNEAPTGPDSKESFVESGGAVRALAADSRALLYDLDSRQGNKAALAPVAYQPNLGFVFWERPSSHTTGRLRSHRRCGLFCRGALRSDGRL